MKIRTATIENVKNFRESKGVQLSNYTVFIGKNGSGKSNYSRILYETTGLQSGQGYEIIPFQTNYTAPSSIKLRVLLEGEELMEFAGSQEFAEIAKQEHFQKLVPLVTFAGKSPLTLHREFTSSKIKFAIEELPTPQTNSEITSYSHVYSVFSQEFKNKLVYVPDTRDISASFRYEANFSDNPISMNNFMTFLTDLKLNDRENYDSIITMYNRLASFVKDLTINPVNNTVGLSETGNFQIPISEVSKGTREILVLATMLALARPGSILFIEEPEIHLHEEAVEILRDVILEQIETKNLQVIITTHNPDFLVGVIPESDERKVIKFIREEDGSTSLHPVSTLSELSEAMEELGRKSGPNK